MKFTYIPPNMSAGFISRTNDPVFPRGIFPALWMVISGSCSPSALGWLLAAADAVGTPPGLGAALVTGASANASAHTNIMAMNTGF